MENDGLYAREPRKSRVKARKGCYCIIRSHVPGMMYLSSIKGAFL